MSNRLVCVRQGNEFRRVPWSQAMPGVILRGWTFTTKNAYRRQKTPESEETKV